MQIFIQTATGKVIPLEVSPSDTVKQIKVMLRQKEGVLLEEQTFEIQQEDIYLNGKLLRDNKTLSFYKISEGTTLTLPDEINDRKDKKEELQDSISPQLRQNRPAIRLTHEQEVETIMLTEDRFNITRENLQNKTFQAGESQLQESPSKKIFFDEDSSPMPLKSKQKKSRKVHPNEMSFSEKPVQNQRWTRKKVCWLIAISVLIAICLALIPVYLAASRSHTQAVAEKPEVIMTRTFKAQQQDTYRANLATNIIMGSETNVHKETSNKLYTITVTTLSVDSSKAIVNFYLFENAEDPDHPDLAKSNGIPAGVEDGSDFLPSSSQGKVDADALKALKLKFLTCELLMTGKIGSCLKPNYLDASDYGFLLNVIDQLSPVLEAKYYKKDRRLQESMDSSGDSMAGYVENRQFQFTQDANGGVTIENSYQTPNTGDGSLSHTFKNSAIVDKETGQITNAKQSGSSNLGGGAKPGEMVEKFEVTYDLQVNLEDSKTASEKLVTFMNDISKVPDILVTVISPIENRSSTAIVGPSEDESLTEGIEGAKESQDPDDPEEPEETEEDNPDLGDDSGSGRMLAQAEIVADFKKPIFESSLLGQDISAAFVIQAFDYEGVKEDKCIAALKAHFFFFDIDIIQKKFDCQISFLAKSYKFIKSYILNNVQASSTALANFEKKVKSALTYLSVDSLALVFLRLYVEIATIQLNTVSETAAKVWGVKLDDFSPKMEIVIEKALDYTIYEMELQYETINKDLWLFMSSLRKFHKYIEVEVTSSKYINTKTYNDISKYLDDFKAQFSSYISTQTEKLKFPTTDLDALFTEIRGAISEIPLNSTYQNIINKDASELEKARDFFAPQFAKISGKTTQAATIYYENFLMKLYINYEVFMTELVNLQSKTIKILKAQTSGQAGQIVDAALTEKLYKFFSFNNVTDFFITTIVDTKMIGQALQKAKEIFQASVIDYLNVRAAAGKIGITTFNEIYKNLSSNMTSYSESSIKKFQASKESFEKTVSDAYTAMLTNFTSSYKQMTDTTADSYTPSLSNLEGTDQSYINLFNAKDDIVKMFDDLNSISDSIQSLKNSKVGNVDLIFSTTNVNAIDLAYQNLKLAYKYAADNVTLFRTKFNMEVQAPAYNFEALYSISNRTRTEIKSAAAVSLQNLAEKSIKDITQNIISKLKNVKELLTKKLENFLKKAETDVSVPLPTPIKIKFDQSITLFAIPLPIGVIRIEGGVGVTGSLQFSMGIQDGGIFVKMTPEVGFSMTLGGAYGFVLAEAGVTARGTLFTGSVPTSVTLYPFEKYEVRIFSELVIKPLRVDLEVWGKACLPILGCHKKVFISQKIAEVKKEYRKTLFDSRKKLQGKAIKAVECMKDLPASSSLRSIVADKYIGIMPSQLTGLTSTQFSFSLMKASTANGYMLKESSTQKYLKAVGDGASPTFVPEDKSVPVEWFVFCFEKVSSGYALRNVRTDEYIKTTEGKTSLQMVKEDYNYHGDFIVFDMKSSK